MQVKSFNTVSPRLARVFFIIATTLFAASSQAAGLDFDKTFNDKGESRQLHYQATYSLDGKIHQVDIWRDRNQQLKRRTDDAVETFIFKPAKQTEWSMIVLDLKRKIRTDIDRTNLYRIGHFTDWFSMSHSLSRPSGAYQLSTTNAPMIRDQPVTACTWYSLTRGQTESKICWSKKLRIPLLITDLNNQVQWKVTKAETQNITPFVFQIKDQGFVRNNANEDIQAD
ncbi:hypothetical protein QN372_10185 [Undibacterium sp. RTI2.1]|nr:MULTISPECIES: hypothetical protein [unclassified Undibacterium]MDY7540255.1 hypothetical protein [Undibacterium sp. 5I1]MEB0031116.1 hypothetical protein [Undibacterium sp. RTI2.1]MEB0259388.1 hypothetical protein [Undibacterium sp. 5I1]